MRYEKCLTIHKGEIDAIKKFFSERNMEGIRR